MPKDVIPAIESEERLVARLRIAQGKIRHLTRYLQGEHPSTCDLNFLNQELEALAYLLREDE